MSHLSVDAPIQLGAVNSGHRLGRVVRLGLLWLGGLLLAGVLSAGGTYLYIQRDGNFHTVEPQLVYRSAQPTGDELRKVVLTHGIKTVLNLRGDNAGKPWYDDEMRAVRALGIQHLDVRLSAYQTLSVPQMDEIVRLIDGAPKPLLIHCESGADRTGLVAALYRVSRGQPAALAERELAPHYGHFATLFPRSAAMDRNLATYLQSRHALTPP